MSSAGRTHLSPAWPELPYQAWRDTKDTLHMCLQVVGKVRLALTPREPQWANVPLYLTARGLTTTPMRGGSTIFEIAVDLHEHQVIVTTAKGDIERVALASRPVADFYQEFMGRLRKLGIEVEISTLPSEVPDPVPFPEDTAHSTYDPVWSHRFWSVLSEVDLVMKEHRARFRGKTSSVHFFWGTFDLANARFSGRPAKPPPGADLIMRVSADAEQICAGFWPGDDRLSEAAFFAYAYPKPVGIETESVLPNGAIWNTDLGEFTLSYETVRRSLDPRRALLDFLESTYKASATRQGWSPELVSSG
jgi:hypothetical protein